MLPIEKIKITSMSINDVKKSDILKKIRFNLINISLNHSLNLTSDLKTIEEYKKLLNIFDLIGSPLKIVDQDSLNPILPLLKKDLNQTIQSYTINQIYTDKNMEESAKDRLIQILYDMEL